MDKCESCRKGYNGTNGNGYMPCGCKPKSNGKPPKKPKFNYPEFPEGWDWYVIFSEGCNI